MYTITPTLLTSTVSVYVCILTKKLRFSACVCLLVVLESFDHLLIFNKESTHTTMYWFNAMQGTLSDSSLSMMLPYERKYIFLLEGDVQIWQFFGGFSQVCSTENMYILFYLWIPLFILTPTLSLTDLLVLIKKLINKWIFFVDIFYSDTTYM
jgi:hypothetical protein